MTTAPMNTPELIGRHVVGPGGEEVGVVTAVFRDDETGKPEWARLADRLIPLAGVRQEDSTLHVPFGKKLVLSSPDLGDVEHISPEQEEVLYAHYRLTGARGANTARGIGQLPAQGGPKGTGEKAMAMPGQQQAAAKATQKAGTDRAMDAEEVQLVRHEERLAMHREQAAVGVGRLRKLVESERFTERVQGYHEEVEVIREPMNGERVAEDLDTDQVELILHQERIRVDKERVPVERVRLRAKRVPDEHVIDEELHHERIEVEPLVERQERSWTEVETRRLGGHAEPSDGRG